jgi:hypothetical protein
MTRAAKRFSTGYRFTADLLQSIKRQIREVQGPSDPDLEAYYRAYSLELERCRARPVPEETFLGLCRRSAVTLVGDFHTLDQSQKTFLRLLDSLGERRTRPIVGLEMVSSRHDIPLLKYLGGETDDAAFLEAINYFKYWGFDFLHYRPILEHARRWRLAVHGVNKEGPLLERDRFMAHRLKHLSARYPGQPVVALVGDMHLAAPHLPGELEKIGISPLLLFQNSETVYMRKLKRGQPPTGFWGLGRRRFLSNNTPPTIKMQTYLTWLEHGTEALCALFGYCASRDADPDVDITDTILRYIRALKDLFGLRYRADDDFQVYTFRSFDFLKDAYYRRGEGGIYAAMIRDGQSLFVGRGNVIYVPALDVNRTVEESMHYLMGTSLPTGSRPSDLTQRMHYFASGFLASKLINPSRRTAGPAQMESALRAGDSGIPPRERLKLQRQRSVYEAALGFFSMCRPGRVWSALEIQSLCRVDTETLFGLSRAVGYVAGDTLFGLYDEGRLSGADLRRYVFTQKDPFYLLDWLGEGVAS